MNQTIRQMRELRSRDNSNHTLRFNRTLRQVGWHGMTPTPAGRFWLGYVVFLITAAVLLW